MSGKRYSDEFKIEAVQQVTERGHSVAEVAQRLGITTHSLYAWIQVFGNYAIPAPRAGNTSVNSKVISCCPAGVDQSCAISAMSVLVAVSTTPASCIR